VVEPCGMTLSTGNGDLASAAAGPAVGTVTAMTPRRKAVPSVSVRPMTPKPQS